MITNRSMPRATVIPVLEYPEIDHAIAWLCDAFGFTVRLRIANHRAQLNVGDGAVVVSQSSPPSNDAADDPRPENPTPAAGQSLMIRVEDVDAHHKRAVEHGARVLQPPADHPYGERQYSAKDFAGHTWTFSQSIADVAPETWGAISS